MAGSARTTQQPVATARQLHWIERMLRQAGQPGRDTLAAHNGYRDKDGRLAGLTGGRDGTASLLIDDLKAGNYHKPDPTRTTGHGARVVAPPLRTARTNGDTTAAARRSPTGNTVNAAARFRANAPSARQFTPTDEQAHVIDLAATPDADGVYRHVKIEAGAGTGKTTTLLELCRRMPTRRGLYTTFNRAIVDEGDRKFPKRLPGGGGIDARTMHSLAWRATDRVLIERLDRSSRIHPDQVARRLGIEPIRIPGVDEDGKPKQRTLKAGTLASIVMAAIGRFCQTADPKPGRQHFGRQEGLDPDGQWDNHNLVFDAVERYLPVVWTDLCDPDGHLPYQPAHYLKQWSLSDPTLPYDYIMLDEAQDLAPVMLHVVEVNMARGIQVIAVGDSYQAINEWTGAVDALKRLPIEASGRLTQSFRFGISGAGGANWILGRLGDFRLVGNPDVATVVGAAPGSVRCVLYRSNAAAVAGCLDELEAGGRPFLMGGSKDFQWFCRTARGLQVVGEWRAAEERLERLNVRLANTPGDVEKQEVRDLIATVTVEVDGLAAEAKEGRPHPDLACFETWTDVRVFVGEYDEGKELKLRVRLVDRFGAVEIVRALASMPKNERDATCVHSTAHKVKGCEWDSVQLADDFLDDIEDCDSAELRLLYVAFTRGRLLIDPTLAGCLAGLVAALAA